MGDSNLKMELDATYDKFDFPTATPEVREGFPGHLTDEQQAQVHQFREVLKTELVKVYPDEKERQVVFERRLDTLTLLRFLRARKAPKTGKWQVDKSTEMFIACEQWRKDTKLDEDVATWDFTQKKQELSKYYPQYYHKTDKAGRPVYVEILGGIDLAAMRKICQTEEGVNSSDPTLRNPDGTLNGDAVMLKNLAVEYERLADPRLPATSRKAGALLETCCSILDLKGVSIWNFGQVKDYLGRAAGISQNYYPERLGRMYLINAPMGFSKLWSIVKGFLDPVTAEKIHVLGSGYQKELLEQVPAENLPKRFGGSCDCPGGCEFSDMGPWHEAEWTKPAWWEQAAGAKTGGSSSQVPIAAGEDATVGGAEMAAA